jgi:chaperone BCS1
MLNQKTRLFLQEGRILIMTTNHLDKLDPALTRPGRCDLHLHLGLATRTQITTMYKRFYPEASEDDVAVSGTLSSLLRSFRSYSGS